MKSLVGKICVNESAVNQGVGVVDLLQCAVAVAIPMDRKLQCRTVGTIFTFGRSRMFGPEKLRPLAVGRSRSRRIKYVKQMS